MLVTEKDLEKAYTDYKSWGWEKKDFFPLLYLSREHKLSSEETKPYIGSNSQELGINAYYFDREKKNFYLYSFNWTNNHKNLKDNIQKITQSGLEKIFSENSSKDPFVSNIQSVLVENQAVIDRICIYFIFNGDTEKARNSEVLISLLEDLEAKKSLIDGFFNHKKDITLSIDFFSNESKIRGHYLTARKTYSYKIQVSNFLERKNQNSHYLYLGFINILSLLQMYRDMGIRLFEKNIRAGLSPENSPNMAIRKSLKNILNGQEDPTNFAFHHNGITIFAQSVKIEENTLELLEPRILNGAQTVTSLAHFVDENSNLNPEENPNLQAVEVLTKIIHPNQSIDSSNFIVNVTINNNRQNKVEPWNLRASDLIQLHFSEKFKEELQVYYERQEEAFDSFSPEDLDDMGITNQNKPIQLKKLGQTFLAIQGEIDKISRLREVFEDEKKYKNTFKEKYLKVDAKKILLAYKVQFRLKAISDAIQENSSQKYYELFSKSKNLIWGLILQALLNDSKYENYAEEYGIKLNIETGFTEILKSLGNRRVRPILQDIWKDERYQKYIQEQKYHFLRNKATFDRAMDIAKEQFGWSKLDLS